MWRVPTHGQLNKLIVFLPTVEELQLRGESFLLENTLLDAFKIRHRSCYV